MKTKSHSHQVTDNQHRMQKSSSDGSQKIDDICKKQYNPTKSIKFNCKEYYQQGRKDNQPKCQVCKREDCLNILCHADLEIFKQNIRKDAIEEIEQLIIKDKYMKGYHNLLIKLDDLKKELQC